MCRHQFRRANDLLVCVKCGMTTSINGEFVMFDRDFANEEERIKNRKNIRRGKKKARKR